MGGLPVLIGAHYSVYTRIVHGTLLLKGVPFSFQKLDIFENEGKAKARELGNPFGKIPIFQHGTKTIYETRAITSYLNATFAGANVFPDDPEQQAVCEQILSIADQYIYPILVWKLYVPFSQGTHNEIPNDVLKQSQTCLEAIENLLQAPWACGENITIADLYLEANMRLFQKTPFAASILKNVPKLHKILQAYQGEEFFQNIPHEE